MSTESVPAVGDLDITRYAGTWYEIARLPHSFEKNLERVTATYTLQDDGNIEVVNRGFKSKKGEWKSIKGKAWIPDPAVPARLKVKFFWFFSSEYKVIDLDSENYTYAMVTSSSRKYLWILSRTPGINETLYTRLVRKAQDLGFDMEKLYRVQHTR
ncbi:MAG: lipocalin family protein [Candidatus Latescibacteria bacterium]|nr:lipocalin family protein [Candidatus Latescibacterota bacterium]